MEFDDILPKIGQFGRYQKLVYYMLCIPASLPAVFLTFNQVFMSATPEHWCEIPELKITNMTLQQRLNLSIPRQLRDGANVYSRCFAYAVNWTAVLATSDQWPPLPNTSWSTESCQRGWEFDTTYYDETLVSKLNLVCDNKWWPSVATSAFYVGSLFGNVLFGGVADKWGRKLAFFTVLGLEFIFAIACTFSPDYITYTVFRTLLGLTFPAIFQIPFIIGMELTGPDYRTLAGMVVCIFFASAMCLLAVLAYLCRHWFKLALCTSIPCVFLFGLWRIVPESPRWLLNKGKIKDAEIIVQKIAKSNGKVICKDYLNSLKQENDTSSEEQQSNGALGLIRTSNMRKKTIVITFNWLSNAVVYNGLSYMCANLGVNDYVAFLISGLVEIPSYIITWYAMQRWGRRCSLIVTQLIGGVACVCTMLVPEDQVWVTVSLSMIGKFGISGSFSVIYIFAGELYPTVVRAMGLAISSFVAGIGLIASPTIVYLAVYSRVLPLIIMGLLSVAGALAVVWLPETLGCRLPETIAEGETFGKDLAAVSSCFSKKAKAQSTLNIIRPSHGEAKEIKQNGPKNQSSNSETIREEIL